MSLRAVTTVGLTVALTLSASVASAGPNDLRLNRFGEFREIQDPDCTQICGEVVRDTEAFEAFTSEFGQVMAPRLIAPSETLGQAGFAMKLMTSFSQIPHQEDHWQRGLEGRSPNPVLFSTHLQVRKGLPFSFEVVGNLGHLYGSEIFTMGADLRWALNEGFDWFPDVAVRGTVNTVVGAPELNLVNTGWDLSASKSVGIAGVMALTPYIGYQQLYTIASTRVLNAYPQDPRPPQFSRTNTNVRFAPEFVFGQTTTMANRLFLGTRLNVWIMSFTLEGVLGLGDANVNQYTFAGGFDF